MMDYKSKYLKYKLKYLNLKKMYGGMNFVSEINGHLLSVVNQTIFSNLYKKYLDSMTQKNFIEYQEEFKVSYLQNSLEPFQHNLELEKSQSVAEEFLGIEELNKLKKEIIEHKRRLNDITMHALNEGNLSEPVEERMPMDGENSDEENRDPRYPEL